MKSQAPNFGKSEDQEISGQDIGGSEDQERVVVGFEKLWVWQKAHKLMLYMHELCRTLPRDEKYRKRDQIERSSSSVSDNIAEGHTSYYYKDKIKGFYIARKEAGETQNHIISLSGKGYISEYKARALVDQYEEVVRGINGYVRWIREKMAKKR